MLSHNLFFLLLHALVFVVIKYLTDASSFVSIFFTFSPWSPHLASFCLKPMLILCFFFMYRPWLLEPYLFYFYREWPPPPLPFSFLLLGTKNLHRLYFHDQMIYIQYKFYHIFWPCCLFLLFPIYFSKSVLGNSDFILCNGMSSTYISHWELNSDTMLFIVLHHIFYWPVLIW